METNESILTRRVIGLDDRKLLGKVNELRVDCDTLAVSHYVVGSASTNAPLALPFERALAIGDTFVTIQSRSEFIPAGTSDAQAIIGNGFLLIGVEVYSRTGNKLGTVKSYAFDPVFGTVTSLTLDEGTQFDAASFVFFAPEFVFVDDGEQTAAEMREAGVEEDEPADEEWEEEAAEVEAEAEPESEFVPAESEPEVASEPELEFAPESEPEVSPEPESESEAAPEPELELEPVSESEPATEANEDDAALIEFLVGASTTEAVTSKDGEFSVEAGTELTEELVKKAQAHDALILLTMSVDA